MSIKSRDNLLLTIAATTLIAVPMGVFIFMLPRQQQPIVNNTTQITEEHTPPELLGVPEDHKQIAAPAYAAYPQAFMADTAAGQENARKNVRIFEITRKVSLPEKPAGEHFACWFQQTGDCVSMGQSRAITERLAVQVFKGVSAPHGIVFPPHQYAVARVHNGRQGPPCNSAGAYPSAAALGWKEYGYVTSDDNPPAYSGRLADQWGCRGAPAEFVTKGKKRVGGEVHPIRTAEEMRDALCNLYPCTIAIHFSPGQKYTKDGRNCLKWNGRNQGGHQMCVLAYDGSLGAGREYFWIQNSHGPNAQAATEPMNGEPQGGFWIPMSLMESWLDNGGESWAFSDVAGFPAEDKIDWSIFDQFNFQAPEPKEPTNEDHRAAASRRLSVLAL